MTRPDPLRDLPNLAGLADVRAVLAALNGRAGCRFTAMYRFDTSAAKNLFFYDRDNPADEEAGEMDRIPVEVTYCTIVRDGRQPFRVADALADVRLTGHPSRATVRAYCGVPLADTDGRIFGTLCHFDYEPRDIPLEEEAVMTRVAPLLSRLAGPSGSSRPSAFG